MTSAASDLRKHRSAARLPRLLAAVLLSAALLLATASEAFAQDPGPPAGLTDRDYLAYADGMQALMEDSWEEAEGLYRAGDGSGPMVTPTCCWPTPSRR